MFKAKLAAFAGALILAGSAFAAQDECPNLSDLQTEGVSMAQPFFGSYFTYHFSKYNTDSSWGLVIANLNVESEEEAIELGNEILNNMTAPGVYTPLETDIMCTYETGVPGVFAATIKYEFPSPMKLKQFIQKAH
ncbi:MAG: DUF4949 domain-containing protein [Legionella sp.]|nr:DUF4949 domain-containing protein [Legionella sp.]